MIKSALIFSLLVTLNTTTVSSKNIENQVINNSVVSNYSEDLDWSKIELIEVEEEVELGFDTKAYLPKDFNPLKGKNDLNWNKIELIKVEEEAEIGFSYNFV